MSRKQLDQNTLKVLYRLHRNGHQAYLVGGSVRDLLLGRKPKDFDIGTDATPQQVKRLFRNCFLVGRRFRLAHVRFGRDQVIEVATFRRQPHPDEFPEDVGEHAFFVQNQFGTPREDAFRRDFTINALFYNIADFSIVDHVGGLADLEARRLRVIGDPLVRFEEDPVRMVRALEFSARLGFSLDQTILDGITARAEIIATAAPARVREKLMDLFRHGVGDKVLRQAQELGLLKPLLAGYEGEETTFRLLEELNAHFRRTGTVDEAMLLAALFLKRFRHECMGHAAPPMSEAMHYAGQLLTPHCTYFKLAHGLRHQAKELLLGCFRFARGLGQRGHKRFLHNPDAPRALELFHLWSLASGEDQQLVKTWREALHTRDQAADKPASQPNRRTRRRPRKRRPARTPEV